MRIKLEIKIGDYLEHEICTVLNTLDDLLRLYREEKEDELEAKYEKNENQN